LISLTRRNGTRIGNLGWGSVYRGNRRPERDALIHRQLRRALVRRFPYAVYFGPEAAGVVIFAVLHQRRAPKILDDRVDHPSGWANIASVHRVPADPRRRTRVER
jgi:hypothetical protein